MTKTNYTMDSIPNVSVTLNQVKATSASQEIPFIPCIIGLAPTGPIGELTAVTNYNEAVNTFGLGSEKTPVLYGLEQYLKTYNYANFIRIAGSLASKGSVKVVRTNGDESETTTETVYNKVVTNFDETETYYNLVDSTYVEAKKFNEVSQGEYSVVDKYSYEQVIKYNYPVASDDSSVYDSTIDYYQVIDDSYIKIPALFTYDKTKDTFTAVANGDTLSSTKSYYTAEDIETIINGSIYTRKSNFDPNTDYYTLSEGIYTKATITEFEEDIVYYTRASKFDPKEEYYVLEDGRYRKVEITKFEENVVYYTKSNGFDPSKTYYTLNKGEFNTAVITEFDPEVTYYTESEDSISEFMIGVLYFTQETITVDNLGTVLEGTTDFETELYNGDTISLIYNPVRQKWYITGTLNGVTYTTPKSNIDLSTATADEEEAVLNQLVTYWNALNTGITLVNKFVNKVATDEAIDADDELSGTIELGDSGLDKGTITDNDVIEMLELVEQPTVPTQDVVCAPEFRNYKVVNAGLALKNTYFYIVAAEGASLDDKEKSIANYDASDKGVMYIPDSCIMGNPNIKVPFEIAALYAWASTYNVNRYYAPAGVKRATLDLVSDVLNNLADDDALELYNMDIPANPVKFITNYGFVLYGQKTMDASQIFTNRINVANLVNYILITGRNLLQPYLFDYAPVSTFEKVYMDLYNMMNNLAVNEIVYNDFQIICDASINTEETLRAHELHAQIKVRPINVIEYIYLDLTVTDELSEEDED